ncbi:MAG TPA: hypothetical protein VFJ52_11760, partial [Terriglobia bacterium]|nr:hypothetical protein [Terriglobia bacterium]
RWLSISAICQLAIAVYLYFAMFGFLPVPASVDTYLKDYRARQVVWLASGGVPRMGGSFDESPMFGLFMLSCFVVLLLEAHKRRAENRTSGLITAGAVAAAAGALGSLSDQVLIGAAVIFVALALERMRKPGLVRWMVMLPALALVVFEASRIYAKREAEAGTKVSVYAESLSEREFKARYALKILADEPAALFFGIGPSRFGDYAISSPMYRFESTVQPSTTAVEWFIGYGFIGFIAITLWLYKIGKRAWAGFGYIGLAALFALLIGDMFQARWLWEGWFMALAYLFASPAWARPRPARAASTFRRGPPSGKAPVNPGSERVGDAAGS